MVNEIRINEDNIEFQDVALGDFRTLKQLAEVSLAGAETLTNKTLTSPLFMGTINGWIAAGETWTYVSIDVKTGKINVNADVTGKYSLGMKIKYTQNATVKYGIITAVGAYAAGVTPITFWGGTDYTLADAAISSNFYSVVKAPLGFPLSSLKWTVEVTDITERSQANAAQNTWYNLSAISISLPIGCWGVTYQVRINASLINTEVYSTLSTANNSESDVDLTGYFITPAASRGASMFIEKVLNLAAKTPYYLNTRTTTAGTPTLYNGNDRLKLIIRAICAYL